MSEKNIIKIIGVGNGGCNIVNNMYKDGNLDVSYTVCNTDNKALEESPVPDKLFLESINGETNGRVAETLKLLRLRQLFSENLKMVFITAGMGSYWH